MKVLLSQAVKNVGKPGDVREVKNGFARNYLIPRGMAAMATAGTLKQAEAQRQAELRKEEKKRNSVYERYRDWVNVCVFRRMFDSVAAESEMEFAMVDATIVKVHRHGQGAKGGLRARPSATPKAA